MFQLDQLKQCIEEVALAESYIGEQIPTRWLQFENNLDRLKKQQQDSFYASLDQVSRRLRRRPRHHRTSLRSVKSLARKTSARRTN